ncbi:hypothetical protein LOZ51_006830 [Ophidiomyces ophidiicola]|uniref:uncharacterized protein n=1 Tax=Ophidiomyces ophidiicola TaxID=1387563 RepID=UPI0020C24F81|nr:uncharacterized protein LOZ57_006857 [Ophidiomyces ophidiicola]KAI1932311.1 hypothetical protein LOZ62_006682 [Ophidiomyces ophidiicola]KAI1935894.1 hypothetical protein LOZ57_006857 [Ophidiomyces ophidiicola]KAI1970217.1 hypothetical protein LOZ55_006603 [Ophidiomyces ophidiicola]KAI1983720.1 hypothetical protein LOZ51_006830 [Ophidiomyces ophidiicola]KAI2109247.1 hypothetical protein LOZ32_006634 [Ophidiomyces ophidiicola]
MEPLSVLIERWLDWDQDPRTREEIITLRNERDVPELEKRLRHRMNAYSSFRIFSWKRLIVAWLGIRFGTAGLRGRMLAGFSHINCLTVIQASQGLCKFLKSSQQGSTPLSVVIGRDARYNSELFALLAANVFSEEGVKVWCFDNPIPTPVIPYTVLLKEANAGIMITASHNPAQDNGYKIYCSRGTQINSPIDVRIADFIAQNLEPWPKVWQYNKDDLCLENSISQGLQQTYLDRVCSFVVSTVDKWIVPTPFVYTPLHGVGYLMMSKLCLALNIPGITVVSEQRDPDPDFPTVRFPNPEEAGALDLAIRTADISAIDIVIANDPDADRFALAQKVNGIWFKFTGDQVGTLLASHILDAWKKELPQKPMAMLSTAVSSTMLSKMATKEGFLFRETLTGFKWLANVARQLEMEGYDVPFAFEEALGYMFCNVCYDKDGLTAAMTFLAAQAKWRTEGLTPFTKLQRLYEQYGFHETLNTYFVSPDSITTIKLFEHIRSIPEEKRWSIGSLPVMRWRDVTNGFDTDISEPSSRLPIDPTSQMLTVWSERGIRFTLRASGTEPKVKIYIESCCPLREDAVDAVGVTLLTVLEHWILPFAPLMTYAVTATTSSGYVLDLPRP